MKTKIINQIKTQRVQHGYTQQELAQRVAVSRQSINSIEQGRYVPSLALALKFARTFNCPVEALFQLDTET